MIGTIAYGILKLVYDAKAGDTDAAAILYAIKLVGGVVLFVLSSVYLLTHYF